jgi:hypothetical protein
MGKRSDYVRRERDFYSTPIDALKPLMSHLPESFVYAEPCAGDARLALHLDILTDSNCIASMLSDIEPQDGCVKELDAFDFIAPANTDFIITNPPWNRKILHPMIDHFRVQKPTWLLFDADWKYTKQSIPYIQYCHKIVSIGRIKWIEGSKSTGKDNCAWYLFDKEPCDNTIFAGRR